MNSIKIEVNLFDYVLSRNTIDNENQKVHSSVNVIVINQYNERKKSRICTNCLSSNSELKKSLVFKQTLSQLQ